MSDDDDYFTDDICFDDQTLAILDREEQKYLSQAVSSVPPIKRQKTDNGWTAGIGTSFANVSEFLPEISLNLGGSYGILPSAPNSASISQRPLFANNRSTSRPSSNQSLLPNSRPVQLVSLEPPHNIPTKSVQHSRPPSESSNHPRRPKAHNEVAGLAHDTCSTSILPPRNILPPNSLPRHDDRKDALEAQLQELQQRLDKMSEDNKNIQIALNDARSAKLAKEGEVTVLRKNAQKTAQEHAAQLTKLKAAWEEADTKHARLQKDLREEAERLKTQLVFKQHEQESTFKPPPSVRQKKVLKDTSFMVNSTPSRLRVSVQQNEPLGLYSMERAPNPLNQTLDSPYVKKTSMLPGFENAFNDATPLRPSKNFNEGSRTAFKNGLRRPLGQTGPGPASPTKCQGFELMVDADVSMDGCVDETFTASAHVDEEGDIDMPFAITALETHTKVEEDESMDDIMYANALGPSDWKAELNRIMLMHILPSANTLTIQLLLGAQTKSILESGPLDTYIAACSRCLRIIASASHGEQDWRFFVETLSQSLLSMIPLLKAAHSFLPLAALLNLLAVLIYSLPDFGSFVLSQPCDAGTSDSRILVCLSEIILEHREMEKQDFHEALATEVVSLLEALAYTVTPELVERLAYISFNRQVLMNLFRANQPPWLLSRSARLLVILASHQKLCRFLLSLPDSVEEKTADPQKIPLIERLCLYLMDAGRKDADSREAKTSILTFFALLSNSQPDVHAHLLMSTTVIPSLVFFLAQLTTAFWEDDEELMSASSEEISITIHTLNQALFLLHHFVFTSVSFINLRQKLDAPYHRIFNGLMHMFIVTFGRLSYGEAPEWIHRQGRIDLVSSTDMARDILDHVVDGPEADRTWQAYQLEGERSGDTDEEEMEEQLLGERI